MTNGVFEASDTPGFERPDTLHIITIMPKRLFSSIVLVPASPPHRYLRYKGADKTNCDVAEIAFYANVSDSLLFYFTPDGGWISLVCSKADSDMLTMKAPEGALLYLHCLD